MQLSRNFTLDEFLYTKYNISLNPQKKTIEKMKALCSKILQPCRDFFGVPMVITSGYRNIDLTKALRKDGYPASLTSQHMRGEAADFRFYAKTISQEDLSLALWDAYYWIYHNQAM